jgi:hypothetical protein
MDWYLQERPSPYSYPLQLLPIRQILLLRNVKLQRRVQSLVLCKSIPLVSSEHGLTISRGKYGQGVQSGDEQSVHSPPADPHTSLIGELRLNQLNVDLELEEEEEEEEEEERRILRTILGSR